MNFYSTVIMTGFGKVLAAAANSARATSARRAAARVDKKEILEVV